MSYVDFILNLAGLLLWTKWRSLPFDPFTKRTPATLVGTLRRAAPSRFRRWHLLAGIGLLLFLRALVYWWIGAASHWTARLDLNVMSLSFRSDWFGRMFLFSVFSFGLTLGVFYLWLLLLSLLRGKSAAAEPVHRLVRVQLGKTDDWPHWVKAILPFAGGLILWWLASWLLTWQEIIPRPVSAMHRIEEAMVVGMAAYLAWKFIAAALLVLHLVNTYVYFGRHPFWNYVHDTAQNLLAPLRKIPLRGGKMDFAPVVGIALIFLIAGLLERGLVWLYSRLPF
ncbi:MAG: YggT family protein [Limisphaerales bacterium]